MCQTPLIIKRKQIGANKQYYTNIVPCGKCEKCKRGRVNDWAFRLTKEGEITPSFFVTLTYDEDNVPIDEHGNKVLNKRDLQLFFKRLRKQGNVFRYYAVGEYGSKTLRPHYHVIFFTNVSHLNFLESLKKAWTVGFVHCSKNSPARIRYSLKYLSKRNERVPITSQREFSLMSKGLGQNYLTPNIVNYHKNLDKSYITWNGVKYRIPKYYKEKIYTSEERARLTTYLQQRIDEKMELELQNLRVNNPSLTVKELLNLFDKRKSLVFSHADRSNYVL